MVLQIFRRSRPEPPEAKASAAAPVVAFHGAGRVAWSARDTATLTRVGFLANPVAFRCVIGVYRRRRDIVYPALAIGCAAAAGAQALLDSTLQAPATSALLAFILGLGYSQSWTSTD